MKIQSIVLASMLAFVGTTSTYNTAFADTTAKVTATCKDGTPYIGDTKKGACSGHKGVKEWGDVAPAAAAAPAAVAPTTPAPAAAPSAPASKATATKTTNVLPATAAPGGGAGKVWVNGSSKVYHCQSDKYYGKTKTGSYMTEAEAKAAGNHADHGKACS